MLGLYVPKCSSLDKWKFSHQYGLTIIPVNSCVIYKTTSTKNVVKFGICPRFNKLLSLSVPNALITTKNQKACIHEATITA